MKPAYQYLATIVSIHDGDTLTADIDCGFRVHYTSPLRFYGINAPELSTPAGKTALAYLETLLSPGDTVMINTFRDHRDKYGRWVAQITKLDGTDINQAMIDSGNAVPFAATPSRSWYK